MKFSIKDFFSKYDQIRSFLRIWSHLLKKSLMENLIFCAVKWVNNFKKLGGIKLNHWIFVESFKYVAKAGNGFLPQKATS